MSRYIPALVVPAVAWLVLACPAAEPTTTAAAPKKIAHFRLAGPIAESPSELQLFAGPDRTRSLRELLDRIKRARLDANVVALAIELNQPLLGWAQIQEIAHALRQCSQAGKKVFCFLEQANPSTYLLAANADHITLAPAGVIELSGLHGQLWYFKGLLDKLGLQADLEHVGAYKGSAEIVTSTQPSEPIREQLDWLFDDLYQQIIDVLVRSRSLEPDQAVKIIDHGWFTAPQAADATLVDRLACRQDFTADLVDRYGPQASLAIGYGRQKGSQIDLSSPFSFFKLLGQVVGGRQAPSKPAVALVYIDGMITTGKSQESLLGLKQLGSTTIRKALDRARKDHSVKAVVVRIDSSGGSALASDIIFNALRRCGQEKPVIVSMGNIAASGGYYIAVAGDQIFAQPGSITGSIGVIGGKLVLAGLLEKIGITTYDLKRGRHADLFSSHQRFTEDQRALLQAILQDAYQRFKQRVLQCRQDRLKADISELAGGRVFTGRQAVANGLVDRIGGLPQALALAAERAGLVEYDVRVMPPPRTVLDALQEMLGLGPDPDESLGAGGLDQRLRALALTGFDRLAPRQMACLRRIWQRIDLLSRDNILLVMPYELCWP